MIRYLETNKLITFWSTIEQHSESVLDESLIGLMIDDGLDNYNDYYKCKLMEIAVNKKH